MTSGTNDAWIRWVGEASATTTWDTTGHQVMRIWAAQAEATIRAHAAGTQISVVEARQILPPVQVTAEERARREAEAARWQRRAEEAKAFAAEANRKAEILLLGLLNDQQKEDLKQRNCFFLYSKGKKYRIDRGQHGNVKLLNEKNDVVESYCIQPRGGLPDADAMAAQKLLLETNPEEFRAIANVTIRGGGYVPGRRAAL